MKSRLLEVFVLCCALALKVNAQTPVITSQPQSITVNNASAAAFTVVATNAASYQWYFQGSNNLAGATNSTLSLDDVSTNQAGSYTVVVTSSGGVSVTSAPPAVLTIVPGTIIQWTFSKYPDGSSSNFMVQLFDHDKPATVENFIHYITSGSYSNMFIDRDVANFVLQGGDYYTYNRTNSLQGAPISTGTNIFPTQLENEFGVGPLIHNNFGTLAMALASGETNSATSAFFFNLTNNSASLDSQDFTVFGRILTGTNILQYFNTLTAPTNGIYYLQSSIPTLPVNYDGTNFPGDSNLFYCDFAFVSPTNAPVDTTPPTVSITFPAPDAVFTNGSPFTITGTAADNVSLAEVFCILTSLSGNTVGESLTNAALGTFNWSVDLASNIATIEPGVYQLTAYAQDGAGNLSVPATNYFTNLAQLTVVTNLDGALTTNTQYVVPGQPYSVTAEPAAGEVFVDWLNQGVVSIDPVQSFTAESNLTLTVTLLSETLPTGLAITSPVADSTVRSTNTELTISGILPSSTTVTQLTCQLFTDSNAVTAVIAAVISGTNWSLVESNLTGGPYTIVAVGEDDLGEQGLVSENFTLQIPPVISSQPTNLSLLAGATAVFSVTASNVVSYQWQLVGTGPITGATNATYVIPSVTTNLSGTSYDVVLTAADGETVTSAPAVLRIVTGTMVQIKFSGFPDGSSSNVIVQLFDHEKPATVANFIHYITPLVAGSPTNTAFHNMIWDRCIPGFVLQGGDYAAVDRTNGTPPAQLQSIVSEFTEDLSYTPPFPFNVDNEYNVGPVIPNTFGTLAMAKTEGNPDSAENGFFFNLADNSSNLDNQSGGFTVFGQIISGSNVLQYFNTLSKPTQGIFDETTVNTNGQALSDLPVNNHNWNVPANTNLFFADFTLLSTPNEDTNPPTVAMSYPTNGQTMTNADIVFRGTASDDVGLARVVCSFSSVSTGPGSLSAAGTTNWSTDFGTLPPGNYTYNVVAQDGSGNESSSIESTTGTFVVPRFPFEASTNGDGTLSTNLNGTNTTLGSKYPITAKPGRGAVFLNWVMGNNTFLFPTTNFTMQNGLQMTANFLSNPVAGGISITYPTANEELTNQSIGIKGKVATSVGPAQITYQFFSAGTGNSLAPPLVLSASNTWIAPALEFAPGDYIVQASTQGTNGRRAAVTTQHFTVLARLSIVTYGPGKSSIPDGTFLRLGTARTITAIPAIGQSFLSWNGGGGSIPLATVPFTMSSGLTLTATFVSNSLPGKLTFTSPTANGTVKTTHLTLGGKIASSVVGPGVMCQLFKNNAPLTQFLPAAVTGSNWSLSFTNMEMGYYTVAAMATDATGKTTLASDKFIVNYYPNIAGIYQGLFLNPSSVSDATAGSVSFTLTDNGLVYGNLVFPSQTYTLYFPVGPTGTTTLAATGAALNLTVSFDITNFSEVMTGSVFQGLEASPLTAYRTVKSLTANSTPSPGTYVLNLEPVTPTDGPPGDSFASVIMSAGGNLSVAGTLAFASTPFSLSTGVFTNGVWPFYTTLYKGNGMLIGWETNLPSGDCNGTLYWIKSPTNGLYYTNGIFEQLNSIGAKFVAPKPGTNYQIVFGGGTLETLVTNEFSFKNGLIVPAAGTTDKLTGSLLSTGVFKGSILNPFNDEKLPFSGAFISPTNGGGGFTLDTSNQTGFFGIGLAP